MDARVLGRELWMESTDKLTLLTGGNHLSVDSGKHLHTLAYTRDVRCTDKRHRHLTDALEFIHHVETSKLSAVSVAAGRDIHCGKMGIVKHNQTCTGAEYRQSTPQGFADGIPKLKVAHDARHSRTFSARNDESILFTVPVGTVTYKKCICT